MRRGMPSESDTISKITEILAVKVIVLSSPLPFYHNILRIPTRISEMQIKQFSFTHTNPTRLLNPTHPSYPTGLEEPLKQFT